MFEYNFSRSLHRGFDDATAERIPVNFLRIWVFPHFREDKKRREKTSVQTIKKKK